MAVLQVRRIWWISYVCLLSVCCGPFCAQASSYRVIYDFNGGSGSGPEAGLIKDDEGRLYGTTSGGGSENSGTIFRLTKPASGSGPWTEETLHSFSSPTDGAVPVSPLSLGPVGEIYGTTVVGGAFGFGTIYRLDNLPGWPLTVLHSFGNPPDGRNVDTGVVFGANSLLYGDSPRYSLKSDGMAFSVSPLGDSVEFAIIEKFGSGPGGKQPSQLIANTKGKLYGTATIGGTLLGGTAFSLALDSKGVWRQRTLYNFGGAGDVVNPGNPLLIGHGMLEGSLFGCDQGGSNGQGAVFRLDPPLQTQSTWTETILYNFGDHQGDPHDTDREHCGLTQDSSGKLFGITYSGGANNAGAFFELDPPTAGATAWSEQVLHSFGDSSPAHRGSGPNGAPLRIGGTFYGTTYASGLTAGGVVWELTP